eukprot:TRINITY_DN50142_c0_g1_i1.p1 TRINITY_DN50142_c0_g1~~TRINITY_DN50142_c0_g1_i1.p1  ORF type:complete len:125 (-),score=19.71 TRINITY_DN50142_c0_g1_i1:45-419(-)
MELFQSFCSSTSCGSRKTDSRAEAGPAPEMPGSEGEASKEGSKSGFLDALSLKPSVVDDGELVFPPRWQARPPPRQRNHGGKCAQPRIPNSYAGADFQDLPAGSGPLRMSQVQADVNERAGMKQ